MFFLYCRGGFTKGVCTELRPIHRAVRFRQAHAADFRPTTLLGTHLLFGKGSITVLLCWCHGFLHLETAADDLLLPSKAMLFL